METGTGTWSCGGSDRCDTGGTAACGGDTNNGRYGGGGGFGRG